MRISADGDGPCQSEFEVQNARPRKNGGDLVVGMSFRVVACNVEQNGGLPASALVVGEDMRAGECCLSTARCQQEQTWLTEETPDVDQSQGPKWVVLGGKTSGFP